MLILSDRIRAIVRASDAGFWLERAMGACDTLCLVVKLPASVAKAILVGRRVEFRAGIVPAGNGSVMCAALGVWDHPDDPYWLFRALDIEGSHHLLSALTGEFFQVQVMDESNQPVLTARGCGKLTAQSPSPNLLRQPTVQQIVGEVLEEALDHFWVIIRRVATAPLEQNLVVCELLLYDVRTPVVITPEKLHGHGSATNLSNREEGQGLEQLVCRILFQVFSENVFLSPRVIAGSKNRELTDVLVIWGEVAIAFECKAAAIFDKDKNEPPTLSKRGGMVEKQIVKAIRQLVGVRRALQTTPYLIGPANRRIDVPAPVKFQGVCVISTADPTWKLSDVDTAVGTALMTKTLTQVMDLTQLARLVSLGPTPDQFMLYLEGRWAEAFGSHNPFVNPGATPPWLSA